VAIQVSNKNASAMVTQGKQVDICTNYLSFLISSLALCIYYTLDPADYFSAFYICRKLPQHFKCCNKKLSNTQHSA